ncbi:MAG: hypothetical protein LBJ82_01350 [Deltaproteobacteria bacterium]|jgi:hypothetical protein|nr:hypothetical protein [Deltaproteobacteria bacterium]
MLAPGVAREFVNTPQDLLDYSEERSPGYGEFLGAAVAGAFERTSTGALLAEARVLAAEKEAYGFSPGIQEEGWLNPFSGETIGAEVAPYIDNSALFIGKEEWNEKHPLFREGIAWREDMTEVRVRIYAEDYDLREHRTGSCKKVMRLSG